MLFERESMNAERIVEVRRELVGDFDNVVDGFAYFDYPGEMELPVVGAAEALSDVLRNLGF
jgi:hypothetical protein